MHPGELRPALRLPGQEVGRQPLVARPPLGVEFGIGVGDRPEGVEGEVEQPGLYPVTGRMTLIRAVATARGLNEYANANHIVVFRQVNGKQMAALYDLRAIRQGMYEDPEVFANDVVSVGESGSARIFQRVVASSALLAAPLVAILN